MAEDDGEGDCAEIGITVHGSTTVTVSASDAW